ncbi:sodium:proton antiporter [Lactiplantibacillus pentosus]
MIALGMQPGLMANHTIVINNDLSYQLQLIKQRFGQHLFLLKVSATTTLGTLTFERIQFTNFAAAHDAFEARCHQLTQH